MKQLNHIIFILILGVLISSYASSQTQIEKSVIGSGGNASTNGSKTIQSTVGQSVISRISNDTTYKSLGFWYSVRQSFDEEISALVVIPTAEAEVGERVSIPLLLKDSKNLAGEERKWSAVIAFNSTILFPEENTPPCGTTERCEIELSGVFSDSSGILFDMDFTAKLGAVIDSDLEIVSFQWEDKVETITKNGFFQLHGVCEIDGEYRLIKRSVDAFISDIAPNPTPDISTIEYRIREKGIANIDLIGTEGKLIKNLDSSFHNSGEHSKSFDFSTVPSGVYYIQITSPNEVFTKKLVVQK